MEQLVVNHNIGVADVLNQWSQAIENSKNRCPVEFADFMATDEHGDRYHVQGVVHDMEMSAIGEMSAKIERLTLTKVD